MGKFAAENQAILEELERKRDLLWTAWYACAAILAIGAILKPVLLLMLPAVKSITGRLQRAIQRFNLMLNLVEALEDEDVQIIVGLEPEGLREIDFFLKFPDKEYVLIQSRSLGLAKVFFNEKLNALQFRQKGGGLTRWKPDPLNELIEQERWIRKNRPDLLGSSSRDKRRTIAKLLVLANETTLGEHLDHLYDTIDSRKYLTIRRSGTSSIVEKTQVADFIRDYVKSRRSSRTLND